MILVWIGVRDCTSSPTHRVTINGGTWEVELAVSEDERYRGLGGREVVPEGTGMLFIFREPRVLDFCMRETRVRLDIAFINSQMHVVQMCSMRVEPGFMGKTIYSSHVPARYALEVPAGELKHANVRPGDTVTFSGSIPTDAKAPPNP